MEELSFSGLVVIAAIALTAPLLLGLAPRLRLPSVVLEIVAGIVIGPAVLGWVEIDTVIRVLRPVRPGLPPVPRGARDRLRAAARTLAPRRGARLRRLVPDRACRRLWPGGGRPGRERPDRGDHPLGDLARGGRAAAEGRRRGQQHIRPADDRRRLHRRFRHCAHPHALLLARGDRDRRAAHPAGRLRGRYGLRGRWAVEARALGTAIGRARAASRTRPPRSACAAPSCCWRASSPSPRAWGSR